MVVSALVSNLECSKNSWKPLRVWIKNIPDDREILSTKAGTWYLWECRAQIDLDLVFEVWCAQVGVIKRYCPTITPRTMLNNCTIIHSFVLCSLTFLTFLR